MICAEKSVRVTLVKGILILFILASYVLQKMMILLMKVLRCANLSTSGPNDTCTLTVDFSATQKKYSSLLEEWRLQLVPAYPRIELF